MNPDEKGKEQPSGELAMSVEDGQHVWGFLGRNELGTFQKLRGSQNGIEREMERCPSLSPHTNHYSPTVFPHYLAPSWEQQPPDSLPLCGMPLPPHLKSDQRERGLVEKGSVWDRSHGRWAFRDGGTLGTKVLFSDLGIDSNPRPMCPMCPEF